MNGVFAVSLLSFSLLANGLLAQNAELILSLDREAKTVEVLRAAKSALHETQSWELGKDTDLLPHQSLIEIARKEAQLNAQDRKMEVDALVGVDWKRAEIGWYVTVHFWAYPVAIHERAIKVRDDGILMSVSLLPNGNIAERLTRPMSEEEKIQFGNNNKPRSITEPLDIKPFKK